MERESIVELIGNGDVKTTAVATGEEALAALDAQPFDCLVLDLGLPDMSGFELIERMKASPHLSQNPRHRLHRPGPVEEAGDRAAAAGAKRSSSRT